MQREQGHVAEKMRGRDSLPVNNQFFPKTSSCQKAKDQMTGGWCWILPSSKAGAALWDGWAWQRHCWRSKPVPCHCRAVPAGQWWHGKGNLLCPRLGQQASFDSAATPDAWCLSALEFPCTMPGKSHVQAYIILRLGWQRDWHCCLLTSLGAVPSLWDFQPRKDTAGASWWLQGMQFQLGPIFVAVRSVQSPGCFLSLSLKAGGVHW